MAYTVIVLDDHVRSGQATQAIVSLWDADADVAVTRTVDDAWKELTKATDVAYVIVDLLLEADAKQGKEFVLEMLGSKVYSSIPILILSAYPLMIKDLARARNTLQQDKEIRKRLKETSQVSIIMRTDNLQAMREALQVFIRSAHETRQQRVAAMAPERGAALVGIG